MFPLPRESILCVSCICVVASVLCQKRLSSRWRRLNFKQFLELRHEIHWTFDVLAHGDDGSVAS